MKAGRKPMLSRPTAASTGTISASSARLGMVCTIAAPLNSRWPSQLRLEASTPSGMLMDTPTKSEKRLSAR
jgi:hypothetical protein